jgi:FdhD protein
MNPYIKRKILKKYGTSFEETEDYIAVEKRLRISLNGRELVSLYCTPSMIRELVIGLLLTEGVVRDKFCAEKMSIEYRDEIIVDIPADEDIVMGNRTVTSGCMGGITFVREKDFEKVTDNFSIDAKTLKDIFKEFQQHSELFRLTGCVHSAALSDGKQILVFAEDIGRHNAVDKVIGYCIFENIPFTKKLMLISGRLSSEIASKCSRWGIPIVASRTAPTDLAIEIAERAGVTLIGFVRGERMNVYTGEQRIHS